MFVYTKRISLGHFMPISLCRDCQTGSKKWWEKIRWNISDQHQNREVQAIGLSERGSVVIRGKSVWAIWLMCSSYKQYHR